MLQFLKKAIMAYSCGSQSKGPRPAALTSPKYLQEMQNLVPQLRSNEKLREWSPVICT